MHTKACLIIVEKITDTTCKVTVTADSSHGSVANGKGGVVYFNAYFIKRFSANLT